MKYFECIYNDGSGDKEIKLRGVTEEKAKELEGKIFCSGISNGVICRAPLKPAHNAFDGGKTMHFRAKNEDHIPGCPYKDDIDENGVKRNLTIVDGYFTEDQINSFVRELDNRVSGKKRSSKSTKTGKSRKRKVVSEENKSSNLEDRGRVRGGNVVAGNKDSGKKGRMRTLTEVTEDDINTEVGVYGNLRSFSINDYGEATLVYKEERLKNIQVKIGQIYKNNNPQEFSKINKVKAYVDYLIDNNKEVRCISAGLVNKYNDNLVIELQTNRSFRINGKSIWDIVRTQF
ncbi:hypothetical protein H8J79_00165 [Clostridium perfringens]|uniref:hypothetical protein n=1 Tax=Clostridium perfringens TaxID=1502 RepID=UPI00103AE97F|nr:hypothetical protein [Clostridium perfringens]MBI6019243.1 hypothetical protein [Clostridium perfringens]TBX11864.1 hypothetical protein BFS03_01155 [Clostridium perfringens]